MRRIALAAASYAFINVQNIALEGFRPESMYLSFAIDEPGGLPIVVHRH
jgi:hypothetical protein